MRSRSNVMLSKQDWEPPCFSYSRAVSFASRALTSTETRYAQIEKELLAVVFACEKFDKYIFGRDIVHVETDHKPLEAIFKKSLCDAPAMYAFTPSALQS